MSNMQVSVILTSYNYGQYLKDTINSVLNQTFKDWELIVVDDCSTDNSVEIITEFANSDGRIKVIRNYENQGLAAAVQTGLIAATGEWVAFLESDDLWREDYLQTKLEAAEKYPGAGFIYNGVEFFDKNAESVRAKFQSIIDKNRKLKSPRKMFYSFGYENPVLTMSSVMAKRVLFDGLSFDTPIDKLLDWYLYIQLARKTDFYYIDKPLTLWRQHSDSYLNQRRRIKFRFANVSAYLTVLRQEPWNLKLLIFIILSAVLMCFKRLKIYFSA